MAVSTRLDLEMYMSEHAMTVVDLHLYNSDMWDVATFVCSVVYFHSSPSKKNPITYIRLAQQWWIHYSLFTLASQIAAFLHTNFVFFSYLHVGQRHAPAMYLPFSKGSPNVWADFPVEFSFPDTGGESSRRGRSKESAPATVCVVNQLDWNFSDD